MDTIGTTSGKTRHTDYGRVACPVEATLELIGGKWKGIVLYYLLDGRLRFSELKRRIGCVTQRMLTKQLRELESSGLVNRIVYAEIPPRVEYELTEEGKSLKPILAVLKEWGETHALKLLESRGAAEKSGGVELGTAD
ncbi:putative HTH-type transcriptional regulator YybR [Maioricimonas rarisocia]|uniref:Putative HTH-type transcriptional regulator YybR n=1 Tax=Maioricimonas rarisocia TaxID=2528026 RepID=A0A517Z868_9PLAN|nr:helix-turn-helix domain-containing protein [Maioricimonas rarisocia]QDU38631.1 putative HTH-type transcriptional regulator YybR [Maioricimonas rarisocia]